RSTGKDFTVRIDPGGAGTGAAQLAEALAALGVETRRYYSPPVHAMQAYRGLSGSREDLTFTEEAAARVISLPMWSEMGFEEIEHVCDAVRRARGFLAGRTTELGSRKSTVDGR